MKHRSLLRQGLLAPSAGATLTNAAVLPIANAAGLPSGARAQAGSSSTAEPSSGPARIPVSETGLRLEGRNGWTVSPAEAHEVAHQRLDELRGGRIGGWPPS